jgi:hypothetical protein
MTILPLRMSAMTDSTVLKIIFIQRNQRNDSPREFQPIQLAFSPDAPHCASRHLVF